MAFCFQERDKAMIEECLGAVGASPTGDIDLIGDADDGDVHNTSSSVKVANSSSFRSFIAIALISSPVRSHHVKESGRCRSRGYPASAGERHRPHGDRPQRAGSPAFDRSAARRDYHSSSSARAPCSLLLVPPL